jgi:ClpP class serine protease
VDTEETPSADTPSAWLDSVLKMRQSRVRAIEKLQQIRDSIVFVFWNLDELKREDFFTLADMLEEENPSKQIDLVVLSPGGSGEAGYRIGHSFQQWAKRKKLSFRVVIPLYAKSAAIILALGAHQIVMGLHSEIGPIDPQIPKYDQSRERWRYIPALSVMDGLKLVSE